MGKTICLIVALITISNCQSQKVETYFKSGLLKAEIQDYRGSIIDFTKVIELKPDNSIAYDNRGMSKAKLQDYRGAIADYNKAIEIDPDYARPYYNRGVSKAQLQDYRGALADFTTSIVIDPDYADAYYGRGLSKFTLDQKDSGCLDLSKAGELGYPKAYDAIKILCN